MIMMYVQALAVGLAVAGWQDGGAGIFAFTVCTFVAACIFFFKERNQ